MSRYRFNTKIGLLLVVVLLVVGSIYTLFAWRSSETPCGLVKSSQHMSTYYCQTEKITMGSSVVTYVTYQDYPMGAADPCSAQCKVGSAVVTAGGKVYPIAPKPTIYSDEVLDYYGCLRDTAVSPEPPHPGADTGPTLVTASGNYYWQITYSNYGLKQYYTAGCQINGRTLIGAQQQIGELQVAYTSSILPSCRSFASTNTQWQLTQCILGRALAQNHPKDCSEQASYTAILGVNNPPERCYFDYATAKHDAGACSLISSLVPADAYNQPDCRAAVAKSDTLIIHN